MLRLTATARDAGCVEIQVEGWLMGAGVELLEAEGTRHLSCGQELVLDLRGVRYLDAAGASLLRRWAASGVLLRSPSCFVGEVLRSNLGDGANCSRCGAEVDSTAADSTGGAASDTSLH